MNGYAKVTSHDKRNEKCRDNTSRASTSVFSISRKYTRIAAAPYKRNGPIRTSELKCEPAGNTYSRIRVSTTANKVR